MSRLPSAPPNGLYVGIALSREAAFAAIDRATLMGMALISAGFFLALAAAWIGGRHFISRPIARLADAAGYWRRGDFGVRVAAAAVARWRAREHFQRDGGGAGRQQQENAALLATLESASRSARGNWRARRRSRRAEEALLQAQKMEAIGQLTGGIAHDFNNLLMAVLGNFELAGIAARAAAVAHPALRHLADARHSAERGARLTRICSPSPAGKAYRSKRSMRMPSYAAPASCCAASFGRPGADRTVVCAADLWPALADARQIELVLLNLAINARDAMPGGGTITIGDGESGCRRPAPPAGLPAGDYVRLAVSDTGAGMSEEILAKCLEPFFTTKEIGKGSGLGLSVVHGIATQSGGDIEISSEPGQGTVRQRIPAARRWRICPGSMAPHAETGGTAPSDGRSGARVLLVDDDPDVREILAAQLSGVRLRRRRGYKRPCRSRAARRSDKAAGSIC